MILAVDYCAIKGGAQEQMMMFYGSAIVPGLRDWLLLLLTR